ncbi:MAG: hypothetical protein DRG36_02140 [Deltaproteobacteria bacterium]|nr:MAG: hypothetical protein DRG36_02140 [Deltaproteobacteria bacterium]
MGRVKIFTKNRCPRCPAAKEVGKLLEGKGVPVEFYDMETPDGLAEAAFYSIMSTPAILIEDDREKVIAHWMGWVPSLKELEGIIEAFR